MEEEKIRCPRDKTKVEIITCLQNRWESRKIGSSSPNWRCLACPAGAQAEGKEANLVKYNPQASLYDSCPVCGCPKLRTEPDCGHHKQKVGIIVRRMVRKEDQTIAPDPEVLEVEKTLVPSEPDISSFSVPFALKWDDTKNIQTCECGKLFRPFWYGGLLYPVKKWCPECFHKHRVEAMTGIKHRERQKPSSKEPNMPIQRDIQPIPQENQPYPEKEEGVELVICFTGRESLYTELARMAKKEFRTIEMQVLYLLHQEYMG